ncbi:MAG: hypothetical protein U0231_09530 [Nitrospiraceae bacterium]
MKKAAIPLLFVTTVMLVLVLVPSRWGVQRRRLSLVATRAGQSAAGRDGEAGGGIYIASFLTNKGDKLTPSRGVCCRR